MTRDAEPPRRRARWLPGARIVTGALVAALLGFGLGYAGRDANVQLSSVAPAQDAHLDAAGADAVHFRVEADLPALMESATLEFDGTDVLDDAEVEVEEGVLTYRPPERLAEGPHRLELTIDQLLTPWPVRREWRFTVDRRRPEIALDRLRPVAYGSPSRITGEISEPGTLTLDGRPVPLDGRRFAIDFAEAPDYPVALRVTDLAGNSRGIRVPVPVTPRVPEQPTRSVHVTAIAWATPSLRDPVLEMIERGEITAVQLDLKDESGIIGYDSRNRLGRRIGAVQPSYRLKEAVADIHGRGALVVGRIVAFRDPVLARAAWDEGNRDQVIQTPAGEPYAGYGGFTNFSHPVVRRYNIDIAREAAEAGVDDILYDYVRRPDGPLDGMVFPGMRTGAQESVATFLGEARDALEPTGAFLGASLFGIAATRPEEIAQNVKKISRQVDYVAPLLYPAGWGPGEYGVDDPNRQPGDIVRASLADFQRQAEGTGARVVPWLQDFSLGVSYGPKEVRDQILAAKSLGIDEWILWNADVVYTPGGIPPN